MYILGDSNANGSVGQAATSVLDSFATVINAAAPAAAQIYSASVTPQTMALNTQSQASAPAKSNTGLILILAGLAVGGVILAMSMSKKSAPAMRRRKK